MPDSRYNSRFAAIIPRNGTVFNAPQKADALIRFNAEHLPPDNQIHGKVAGACADYMGNGFCQKHSIDTQSADPGQEQSNALFRQKPKTVWLDASGLYSEAEEETAAEILYICSQAWKHTLPSHADFSGRVKRAIHLCCHR